jgi:hypothetical protein
MGMCLWFKQFRVQWHEDNGDLPPGPLPERKGECNLLIKHKFRIKKAPLSVSERGWGRGWFSLIFTALNA